MVQWLGLCAFTAEDAGSIPGLGTKIPQTAQPWPKNFLKIEKGVQSLPSDWGLVQSWLHFHLVEWNLNYRDSFLEWQ